MAQKSTNRRLQNRRSTDSTFSSPEQLPIFSQLKDLIFPFTSTGIPTYEQIYNRKEQWDHILFETAKESRQSANSYRGFKVGVAILAAVKDKGQEHLVVQRGANWTPEDPKSKGAVKFCAESVALSMLLTRYDEVKRIYTMTIIGENQPDRHSEKLSPTLRPCGNCRVKLHTIATMTSDRGVLDPEKMLINGFDSPNEQPEILKLAEDPYSLSSCIADLGLPTDLTPKELFKL